MDNSSPPTKNINYSDISNNFDFQFHNDSTNGISTGKESFKKDFQNANYNTIAQYHDDYGAAAGTSYVVDNSGKTVAMPPSGNLAIPVPYFKPKDYVYGSLSYVPSYEDSVYLSRTANMYINKPIIQSASIKAGMCNFYAKNPDQLEEACQNTDPDVCASTSCCVLLGGAKCVSGSANGPKMVSNYSDTTIKNRDYYYFQSKCYGNCPIE
jgi:hypothetical protein